MNGTVKEKLDEQVTTICYNTRRVSTRRQAMRFFYDAMCASEGAEHERYETIFFQLLMGETVATDCVY